MEFLDYFCAFWDVLVLFNFDLEILLIKEYFIKLAVWLVVLVGIAVAMEFFLACFSAFRDLLVYFLVWEKHGSGGGGGGVIMKFGENRFVR